MMRFELFQDPEWLLLLLLLPLLLYRHVKRSRLGALVVSELPPGSRRTFLLHFPFLSRSAALVLLTVAMARPQAAHRWEETITEGVDIQLVLDISGSMAAEDFQPLNRLEVAKQVLREFIARRPGDRMGLTVFSGTAMTRCPLTVDHEALDSIVSQVQLTEVADGTAIGMALANAARRLQAGSSETRIIVLVTDGVNNTGEIDPRSAASLVAGLNYRVYAIGVGSQGEAPLPVRFQDPLTGRTMVRRIRVPVEIDEALLMEIANRTGGKYFRVRDPEAFRAAMEEIDRLKKSEIKTKKHVRFEERFMPWAWSGLVAWLLPSLLALLGKSAEP
jgi:Ca-activated chloride channel family protein